MKTIRLESKHEWRDIAKFSNEYVCRGLEKFYDKIISEQMLLCHCWKNVGLSGAPMIVHPFDKDKWVILSRPGIIYKLSNKITGEVDKIGFEEALFKMSKNDGDNYLRFFYFDNELLCEVVNEDFKVIGIYSIIEYADLVKEES